jgi:hypothetical protein
LATALKTINEKAVPSDAILLQGATPTKVEAESSKKIIPKMIIGRDSTIGSYIHIPNTADRSDDGNGSATYKIDATKFPGKYYLWARVYWLDTSGNSLYAQVGSGDKITLGNNLKYRTWHWIRLGTTLNLTGNQDLRIIGREDGSRLDKIILTTSSGYRP